MMKKSDRKKMEIINKYLDRVYVKGDSNIYEIDMRLKIPIINDKLRFDKKKYRKFIENGGDKKHYNKEFEVVKGEISKKDKICFNNSKFVLNLQPQWPMV